MKWFVYVFSRDAADALTQMGYRLLVGDDKKRMYVFENRADEVLCADVFSFPFVFADTLTF